MNSEWSLINAQMYTHAHTSLSLNKTLEIWWSARF